MKNNPYHLFKAMEDIRNFDAAEVSVACDLFKQIASPFDKSRINNLIFNESKNYIDLRLIFKLYEMMSTDMN